MQMYQAKKRGMTGLAGTLHCKWILGTSTRRVFRTFPFCPPMKFSMLHKFIFGLERHVTGLAF
jgi:hypothetical protein